MTPDEVETIAARVRDAVAKGEEPSATDALELALGAALNIAKIAGAVEVLK